MQQRNSAINEIRLPNKDFLPHVVADLENGHTVKLLLRGFSMRPFLEDNRDTALLTKAVCIRKGDPVLAEISPGRYVLHRIIKIIGHTIILRGDGNMRCEMCTDKDIRANIIGFYRKGRATLDPIDGWKWRLYSKIWTHLHPIRHYLLAIYRIFKRVKVKG